MSPGGAAWRYLDGGAVDPVGNQALMAVLTRSAAEGGRPILQTSVWGRTHLNVGWFDDIDATLDLEACSRLGVEVIRRPFSGGGTAYYDAQCAAMWGVMFPKGVGHDDLDAEGEWMKGVVLDALARIGVDGVAFRGGDLRLPDDRKLGGISANDFGIIVSVGGFCNLARPDMDLYLQVVRVPDDKFKDKLVKDLRDYVMTLGELAGHPVGYPELRDALLEAMRARGVEIEAGTLTDVETAALTKVRARIERDDSLHRVSSSRFAAAAPAGATVGFGNHKGRKLCRAGVAIDDHDALVAVMMAGDMHVSPPDVLDRVAAALIGCPASDPVELRRRVAAAWEADDVKQSEDTGVTTDDLVAALGKAIAAAG